MGRKGQSKRGMEVIVYNSFEAALKIFKEKVARDGILRLVKRRHDGFDPPSVRRRYKHFRYLLRLKRAEERREQYETMR